MQNRGSGSSVRNYTMDIHARSPQKDDAPRFYGAPSSWLGRQTSGVVVSLILYAPPKPAFAMLRLLSSSSGIMSLISPSNNYGPWLSRLSRVLIKSMPIVTGMRTVGVLELKPWLPRAPV